MTSCYNRLELTNLRIQASRELERWLCRVNDSIQSECFIFCQIFLIIMVEMSENNSIDDKAEKILPVFHRV